MHPAVVKEMSIFELPVSTRLSETDLKILKCLLLLGARMAKELGISEKTTTRRLDRTKERCYWGALQCDPASIISDVQFLILESSHYRYVY